MLKDGDMMFLHHEKANYMIPYKDKSSFSSHKGSIKFEGEYNYGDMVETNIGEKFYILRPTLTDWMMKVKRRTNIIYPKDAGVILLELGIQYGTRIIEVGGGAGGLTTLLSRIVGPDGKVFSFERNEEHQKQAIKNVTKLGIPENVEFILKDPMEEEDGFGLDEIDSVFIDLATPWTVIEIAYKALTDGGHIGGLSPNIEQVQGTAEKMREVGFTRFRCIEILTRDIRVEKNKTRPFSRMVGHTGYLFFAEKINK